MKSSEADILIVPGFGDSSADHWQSRWARNLRTARRVEQADWCDPDREAWVAALLAAIEAGPDRPTVLVAHSLGIATILHAAPRIRDGAVAGAFLVGVADLDAYAQWPAPDSGSWPAGIAAFAPMPSERLPFPTRVIASSTDPFCTTERAQDLGAAWGADVSVIADGGHLNEASGHGPWPEGLLTFGMFLKSLG